MRNIPRNIISMILLFFICSCSMGGKSESVIYTLRPKPEVSQQSCGKKPVLQIIEPTVASGLESRRIAILQKNSHLDYYKGVRWAAPVSEMLQNAMVDAFEHAPAFGSIATAMNDISPDLLLTTDIRDFQVNESGSSSEAEIRFVSKLIDTSDHRIIATIPVENSITPSVHKMDNIIAAFDEGSAAAIAEVITRTIDSLPSCK
jgi:ABC-type uncharacterized transport system auxiliary subunit